jgi:hypothetical protein
MAKVVGRGERAARERSAAGRTLEALLIFVAALVTTAALMGSVAGLLFVVLGIGH